MISARLACLLALALAVPAPTLGEEREERGTFSATFENDAFYRLDRAYTNGLLLTWTTAPDHAPDWALRAARRLPFFAQTGEVRATYGLGQNMYTPDDISLRVPPPDDRPYAGWLYGSIGFVSQTEDRLDQLNLQLGVVGPAALAEETQTGIHRLINDQLPRGWDTQLSNEPGVVLTYQRSWRAAAAASVSGVEFDVTPHLGGALGNVLTYANAGATFRAGWRLPDDFGPPRIQPSLPGSGWFEAQDRASVYFFAGLEGRAVARNIFLDGNTWTTSRRVDKRPFVADAQIGVAIAWGRTRLAYTHVIRSREYDGQDEADKFGALSLSVRF